MIDLEAALFDLGEHLDHPPGDDIVATVRDRVGAPVSRPFVASRGPRRVRVLLAVAAAIVATTTAVLLVAPARHAIADWLGIGAVEVRHSEQPVPPASGTGTVPGAPGAGTAVGPGLASQQLDAARRAVHFAIETPSTAAAGPLAGVEVDTRVRDGLVVLRFRRFTIVEVASRPGSGPILLKIVRSAHVDRVTADGGPALWIAGAHEVGYVDRDGNIRTDTVRRSGPVLLWERGDVTYRIEGARDLAGAQAIARTLR